MGQSASSLLLIITYDLYNVLVRATGAKRRSGVADGAPAPYERGRVVRHRARWAWVIRSSLFVPRFGGSRQDVPTPSVEDCSPAPVPGARQPTADHHVKPWRTPAGDRHRGRCCACSRQPCVPTALASPAVRARFYLDGRETHVENIPGTSTPIPSEVEEGDLAKSANAEIPGHVVQPGLEMVIEVDPAGTPRRGAWCSQADSRDWPPGGAGPGDAYPRSDSGPHSFGPPIRTRPYWTSPAEWLRIRRTTRCSGPRAHCCPWAT